MKLATVAALHTQRRARPGPRWGLIVALIVFAASIAFCAYRAFAQTNLTPAAYLPAISQNAAAPVLGGGAAATATP